VLCACFLPEGVALIIRSAIIRCGLIALSFFYPIAGARGWQHSEPTLNVMELTKEFIKSKRPCAAGFRWFLRTHHGGGDYQPLLDALVSDGRVDDACWLLTQFGPTDAVFAVEAIDAEAIVFAGSLEVRGNIDVDSIVRAGRSIKAGGGIRAGTAITAGEDIRAGGGIRSNGLIDAGGDVRAGWCIEVEDALTCKGDLRAEWDVSCGGALAVGGNATIGQDIRATGDVRVGKSLRSGGSITGEGSIHAGNGIEGGASILCKGHLEAGWGIKARGAMVAEGAIKAGESLQAEDDIQAGDGYGIYAGLIVPLDRWETSAQVRARSRPAPLMSGWWSGRV
jgi:predicted acyltransferase (DUF342 family)